MLARTSIRQILMAETLFGHLATHFAPSSENIAIEALGFILARSAAARRAFTAVAGAGGLVLPPDLVFATQAGADDAARPDIEGYSADLKRHVVIECKFWAGLTINQPLTYAVRLPTDASGALVFIVPSARLTSLWSELTKRLKAGDYAIGRRHEPEPELWHTIFGAGHTFALVSWRAVLSVIQREMEAAQELDRLEDLRQLQGLCERMDSEAFLPFRSELTAADVPQRYVQLAQLAYDLGEALIAAGVCDSKRLTASGGMGYYGRYLRAGNLVVFSAFDSTAWHAHKLSPSGFALTNTHLRWCWMRFGVALCLLATSPWSSTGKSGFSCPSTLPPAMNARPSSILWRNRPYPFFPPSRPTWRRCCPRRPRKHCHDGSAESLEVGHPPRLQWLHPHREGQGLASHLVDDRQRQTRKTNDLLDQRNDGAGLHA